MFTKENKQLKPAYMAMSHEIPVIGHRCICTRINSNDGNLVGEKVCTGAVQYVELIGGQIYRAETKNSVYIIQVVKWS